MMTTMTKLAWNRIQTIGSLTMNSHAKCHVSRAPDTYCGHSALYRRVSPTLVLASGFV